MAKIDFKKQFKDCYTASPEEFKILCVPRMQFLMVDGCGDPNKVPHFKQCVEALYAVAYSLKFQADKPADAADYVVPPLEGLWWMDEPGEFSLDRKDQWKWTLMIAQPDFITPQMVSQAVRQAKSKKDLPAADGVRLESYEEGLACQILHVGPYDRQEPLVRRMHVFIHQKGHHLRGRHHEIYLSDPRRVPPEKYRTIIRHAIL